MGKAMEALLQGKDNRVFERQKSPEVRRSLTIRTELEEAGLYVLKNTCSFIHLHTYLFKKYFLNASCFPWEGKGYEVKLKGLYCSGIQTVVLYLDCSPPCPSGFLFKSHACIFFIKSVQLLTVVITVRLEKKSTDCKSIIFCQQLWESLKDS